MSDQAANPWTMLAAAIVACAIAWPSPEPDAPVEVSQMQGDANDTARQMLDETRALIEQTEAKLAEMAVPTETNQVVARSEEQDARRETQVSPRTAPPAVLTIEQTMQTARMNGQNVIVLISPTEGECLPCDKLAAQIEPLLGEGWLLARNKRSEPKAYPTVQVYDVSPKPDRDGVVKPKLLYSKQGATLKDLEPYLNYQG